MSLKEETAKEHESATRTAAEQEKRRLLEQEFKEFDTNGDGALSLDELLQGLRGHYAQDEIQDMFVALDADGNGEISLEEYLRYWQHDGRRNCHEVEMLVQGLKPFRDIASKLPRGSDDDPLGGVLGMQEHEVDQAVLQAVQPIAARIKTAIKKAAAAKAAASAHARNAGGKFSAPLRGGTLDQFYEGVTSIVGEPPADLERGVEKEHLESADSDRPFTTSNYGLTTTPRKEYELVKSGGKGLKTKTIRKNGDQGVEHVVVTSTQGACIGGQEQEDLRVVRPLEEYGDFREDGLLASHEPSERDTSLQKLVKAAGLVRVEVIVLILYTGVFQ